jgi:DNA-binding Lrp family transcriptional regulator
MTGDYLAEEPFCAYQPQAQWSTKTTTQEKHSGASNGLALDALDKKLLSVIQAEMPIGVRPFEALARRLQTDADELLARLTRLKEAGFIRRLGAVFDAARLGHVSCLVTGRVEPRRLKSAAQAVNRLPEVTHNYTRRHEYNLWFTITAQSQDRIDRAVEALSRKTGVDFHLLPTLAVYKINAVFRLDEEPPGTPARPAACSSRVELTDDQKRLVGILQGDLGVSRQPFDAVAARLGWPVERVIGQIADWLDAGVIRRFGAVAAHRKLGLQANGMAVFRVEDHRVDSLGRRLAELPQVSHCYRRRPFPGWKYTLFAMFHGRSEGEVRNLVNGIAGETAVTDYDILFSAAEHKKTSPALFIDV